MRDVNRKTIGILGGMGPQATVDLYQKIINYTPAKKDQDHIHIVIDSRPEIPDRTGYLLGKNENPVPYMVEGLKTLENAGCDFILMPCNTSHVFISSLQNRVSTPIINMIAETANFVKNLNIKRVGLLATTGTINFGIYHYELTKLGIEVVQPDGKDQELVMEAIYGSSGIKSGNISVTNGKILARIAGNLGVDYVICGCTEIVLALKPSMTTCNLVDPATIYAKKAVELALNSDSFAEAEVWGTEETQHQN